MSTGAKSALARSALFAALPDAVHAEVARLMTPVSYAEGEVVFRQGEPGRNLVVIESGSFEALLNVPGGEPARVATVEAGTVIGEMALLGDGRRTATLRAIGPATGWSLERASFDALRHSLTPAATEVARAIGLAAVARLNALYRRLADEIGACPPAASDREPPALAGARRLNDTGYLAGIQFFEDFHPAEITALTADLRCRWAERGALVVPPGSPPSALWIVLRGAVETAVRGPGASRRLRLAGPGRVVGHRGLLDDEDLVAGVESRARERAILLEVPWPRVRELLESRDAAARRFATALWADTVRALQHGQRPLPQATTRSRGREPVVA